MPRESNEVFLARSTTVREAIQKSVFSGSRYENENPQKASTP